MARETLKKLNGLIKFRNKVTYVEVDRIDLNDYNPRKRFGQEEEDELIESINLKGVLQPVIVYKRGDRYTLLDGQRRFQACKKLGIRKIPAHILLKEPNFLENLSLMFHIHNVHEDWTDLAITVSVEKIIEALNIEKNKITSGDIKKIKDKTSLSEYKIKKVINVLQYPDSIINEFMDSEKKDKPDLDLDTLSELKRPIDQLKKDKRMKEILEKYPVERIVKIIIQKKKDKVIKNNKELRKLSKIITNAKKEKIDFRIAKEKILDFLENEEISLNQIYSDTAESLEQAKIIIDASRDLKIDIENIDLRKIPEEEINELKNKLGDLLSSIKKKFKI